MCNYSSRLSTRPISNGKRSTDTLRGSKPLRCMLFVRALFKHLNHVLGRPPLVSDPKALQYIYQTSDYNFVKPERREVSRILSGWVILFVWRLPAFSRTHCIFTLTSKGHASQIFRTWCASSLLMPQRALDKMAIWCRYLTGNRKAWRKMGETSLPLAVTRWPCWTSVRGLLELEQASLFFTIYLVCDILLAALTVFNHANNDIGEAYSNLLYACPLSFFVPFHWIALQDEYIWDTQMWWNIFSEHACPYSHLHTWIPRGSRLKSWQPN